MEKFDEFSETLYLAVATWAFRYPAGQVAAQNIHKSLVNTKTDESQCSCIIKRRPHETLAFIMSFGRVLDVHQAVIMSTCHFIRIIVSLCDHKFVHRFVFGSRPFPVNIDERNTMHAKDRGRYNDPPRIAKKKLRRRDTRSQSRQAG